jgi:hypothetical protein
MTSTRAGITPRPVTAAVSSAEGPEVAPPGAGERLPQIQCARCGAVGTHYLTCPDLRLPSGYRLGDAPGSEKH